mgnify:CR=1 FL=1
MGQKVNPIGLRLGINRNWESRWFPNFKTAPAALGEDHKIRTYLKKVYKGYQNIFLCHSFLFCITLYLLETKLFI